MADFTTIPRRQFYISRAVSVGVLATRAAKSSDPRPVSLGDAHKGTLEIDLRIMNQSGVQPQAVQDFYVACRHAMTGANPERHGTGLCRNSNHWKQGAPALPSG